uniref:hypothetical protein n=1 Tax=Dichomitus squalens TaxID=114155 RepID=UPI0030011933|nr:hypothetical protein [Dichomitus squalens]
MIFLSILILIVAIALPSINQNIRSILYVRISSIIFIYAGALSLNALYIQSIGSGIGIYSGLFQVAVILEALDEIQSQPLLLSPLFLAHRHLFHSSSVKLSNVKPLKIDTKETEQVHAEMRYYSDPMTPSEYNESTITPFKEAFPNFPTNSLANDEEVISKGLSALINENVKNLSNKNLDAHELLSPLYPLLDNKGESNFSHVQKVLLSQNNNELQIQSKVRTILDKYGLLSEENNPKPILMFTDGKLIVDMELVDKLATQLSQFYQDNKESIFDGLSGLGGLFAYKTIVHLHGKYAFPKHLDDVVRGLKEDQNKLDYLKFRAGQVRAFNSIGALLIVVSVTAISHTITRNINKKEKLQAINDSLSQSNNNSNQNTSSIFFLFKNKQNTVYFFILFLILFVLYFLLPFNLKGFTLLKVTALIISNFYFIFNLFVLLLLNDSTILNHKIYEYKFIPHFIQNYFKYLYRISNYKEVYIFIDLLIRSSIFLVALQTIVFILILLIT